MMRFRLVTTAVVLLALAIVPACLELSSTNNGAGGSGSSTGSTMVACDDKLSTCSECTVCAAQPDKGQCFKEYDACLKEPNCAKFDACINACPPDNPMCLEICFKMITDADQVFTNYYFCMYCGACPTSCADTIPCE